MIKLKKLKKFVAVLSSLIFISSAFVGCKSDDEEGTRTLNVFNYGDYINEDLIDIICNEDLVKINENIYFSLRHADFGIFACVFRLAILRKNGK